MLITPEGVGRSLFAEREVCTGSSMVLLLALGRELLWGLCASLVRGGVGGPSAGQLIEVRWVDDTLSMRSKRCNFFST